MTQEASQSDPIVADERPELLIFCGILGILGSVGMVVGTLVMQTIVPNHNPVTETISDLSDGPLEYWMDIFFYLNAAGLIALAIAASHVHLGRWAWSLGIFVLTLIALDVVLLGLWDELNPDPGNALTVHTKLATLLFPLFVAGPLLMMNGMARVAAIYRWLFIASAILWPILALIYFFGPDPVDGLVERLAGASTLLWTVPLGWFFLQRGRRNV